jgi:hypothetical protein
MAKKILIKDKEGKKKIIIPKEKPEPKKKILKRTTKPEKPETKKVVIRTSKTESSKPAENKPTFQIFRISWDKVINTVNDDSGNASELKVFVRILAFDGKGKTIMDEGKKNKSILEWEKLPSAAHQIVPKPWTFTEGSEKNPLELQDGKGWTANKWVEFKIPSKETKAKFGIRVDACEFDTSFNPIFLTTSTTKDFYEDNLWDANISDIKKSKPVDIVIREEAARLTFKFTISPKN